MHQASFVQDLAIVLGVAAITFVVSRRLKQPSVLGYLFAGLIVGPYIPIPLFADPDRVHTLSEFGVVLVMFAIGLEFRLAKLARVLPVSGVAGLIQMGSLMWLGFVTGGALGWNTVQSLFLGASIAISSTMVVSAVFAEQRVGRGLRDMVLGVLVLQDVAAIALIAAMTVVAQGGALSAGDLASLLGRLGMVLLALTVGGLFVVPRAIRSLAKLGSAEAIVVGATGLCFAMAVLAESLGYSVALGAFLAGMLVAESGLGKEIEHAMNPLKHVFSAVFFVSVGMTVDPRLALANLGPALLVSAVVILGQFASVTLGGLLAGNGLRRSVGAGMTLGQVGEFAFIISNIGAASGVTPEALSPILVTVAVLTTFTTPLSMRAAPAFARALERTLPRGVRNLLIVYESWLQKLRDTAQTPQEKSTASRLWKALVLDAVGLVALTAAWLVEAQPATAWLMSRVGLDRGPASATVTLTAVTASLPLWWGLFRNTHLLARMAARRILVRADGTPTTQANSKAAEALLVGAFRATVVLGVGLPAAALLRPLLPGPYVVGIMSVLLGMVALSAFGDAVQVNRDVRSATEHLLDVVARQRSDELSTTHSERAEDKHPDRDRGAAWFPGIEDATRVRLTTGMRGVGQTLAGLDLRATTGVAVLAIQRGEAGSEVLIPSGLEPLASGDVLILAGNEQALTKALALLTGHTDAAPAADLA